jgi:hypothetical protein
VEDPVLSQLNVDELIENESMLQGSALNLDSKTPNNLSSMEMHKQYFASRGINNITELSHPADVAHGVSPALVPPRKGETPGLNFYPKGHEGSRLSQKSAVHEFKIKQ